MVGASSAVTDAPTIEKRPRCLLQEFLEAGVASDRVARLAESGTAPTGLVAILWKLTIANGRTDPSMT